MLLYETILWRPSVFACFFLLALIQYHEYEI